MSKKHFLPIIFIVLFPNFAFSQSCEAPVWSAGDKWVYTYTEGTTRFFNTHYVYDVLPEFYIMDMAGKGLYFFDKKTMNIKFLINKQGVKHEFTGPLRKLLDFPLYVGKRWEDRIVFPVPKPVLAYIIEFSVEGYEKSISHSYKCFKVFCRFSSIVADKKISSWSRYWYSPDVRNIIDETAESKYSLFGFKSSTLYSYDIKK